MFYDIEKFKRFESTVQCTERNLVIIKALLQKNKLSDLGKYLKECSPYDRCQHMRQKVVQFRLIGKVFISPAAGYRFNQYLHFTSLCFIRIFIDFLHFPTH